MSLSHWLLLTSTLACLVALSLLYRKLVASKARLRQSEQDRDALEKQLDAMPLSILLCDLEDPSVPAKIEYCNDHACQMHGYERSALIGRSLSLICANEPPPGYAAVRGHQTVQGEALHRHRDGTEIPTRSTCRQIQRGGKTLALIVDEDRREQRAAETKLRTSQRRFGPIINMSPDAIMLMDPEDPDPNVALRIVECNERAAQMHGLRKEELLGADLRKIDPYGLPTREAVAAHLQRIRKLGRIGGEARHIRKDGTHFPIEFANSIVTIEGKEYLLGFDRDITRRVADREERRKVDEELLQSRKLRAVGALAGGIAHEFNNMLTPMLLHTSLIARENAENAKHIKNLDVICQGVERSKELVQRILAFGRRSHSEGEIVDMKIVIEDNLNFLRLTLDRRIQLSFQSNSPTVWCRCSQSDMNQVIINLVINARDTLLEKLGQVGEFNWTPKIQIAIDAVRRPQSGKPDDAPSEDWLRLSFTDNGMGMAESVKERVFEPFFTTKESGKGTGLGLALVWHLTTLHGGWVDLESEENVGTTFKLYFPYMDPPAETAPANSAQLAEGFEYSSEISANILLVEDDDLVSETTKDILHALGHRVTTIRDGRKAAAADASLFDVIITDLNMPGISGAELVKSLRESSYDGRIIVVSGFFDETNLAKLEKLQIDARLTKPFRVSEIAQALKDCGY